MLAHQVSIETTAAEPGRGTSRRGGRRPGAGAKQGNVNALRHGRRSSRFRHLLDRPSDSAPTDPASVTVRAARRVVEHERRVAEQQLAGVLAVVRHARYLRLRIDAVAAGQPLPPRPAVDLHRKAVDEFVALAHTISRGALEDRRAAAGRLTAADPRIVADRRFVEMVERYLPLAIEALQRSAGAVLTPAELLALAGPATNDQTNDQTDAAAVDSPPDERSNVADSATLIDRNHERSNAGSPSPPLPVSKRRVS